MLTKAQIKHIQSLDDKKYRHEHQQYVIEGYKSVVEIIDAEIQPKEVYVSETFAKKHSLEFQVAVVEDFNFLKISSQKNPEGILAVLDIPNHEGPILEDSNVLMLDNIKDPGNMGTLIRTADWFGIKEIVCSPQCVDVYNRKCIQSSMGSILRVRIHYVELENVLRDYKGVSWAAVLDGESHEKVQSQGPGILVIGSESQGIRTELVSLCTHKVSINGSGTAESLNASVAGGILMSSLFS